jgi:hypothetical protein
MAFGADDLELKAYLTGFRQGLEKRGWLEGRNLSCGLSARGGGRPNGGGAEA